MELISVSIGTRESHSVYNATFHCIKLIYQCKSVVFILQESM